MATQRRAPRSAPVVPPDPVAGATVSAADARPPRRRRPPRAETRARLLDAAAEVFAARGFRDASLEEVAEAAGFSKGAVYSNFSGKDELFYALMTERITERVGSAAQGIEEEGDAGAQAVEVGRRLTEKLAEQPDWHLLFIEFWARAVRDPELRAEFARRRRPVRIPIAELIERATGDLALELPVPADDLAIAVLALSNGLAIERLADPESVPGDLFGVVLELLLAGLAAGADPSPSSSAAPPRSSPPPDQHHDPF